MHAPHKLPNICTNTVNVPIYAETDDKKPQVRVEDALGTLEGVAKREGLTPDQIDSLMEFVSGRGGEREFLRRTSGYVLIYQQLFPSLPAHIIYITEGETLGSISNAIIHEFPSNPLGVSSRSRVVRSLIPQTTVPCSAILKALGCLRSLPITLQQLLLRWTVLVFELIDDRTALHAVYTAVFYLLQADDLVSKPVTPLPLIPVVCSFFSVQLSASFSVTSLEGRTVSSSFTQLLTRNFSQIEALYRVQALLRPLLVAIMS